MAELLFWCCLVLVLQTYLFYPLTVAVLKKRRPKAAASPSVTDPVVSVVIAVYNEERFVRERIGNIYSGSYPAAKIELLVGSDGSDDGTNEILSTCGGPGIRPFLFPARRGKAAVLNDLLREAGGEIVVFSDANTTFTPATIAELVAPFADPSVGAVTGELVLQSARQTVGGQGEVSYWRFENWLKNAESEAGSTLGASGGVYAIRRELWSPLPHEKSIVDDFLIPMNVLKRGYSVKYNRKALAYENASDSIMGEFQRKVRIGACNFNGIGEFRQLLHPRSGFVAFALWSHKIIRWFVPFLLLVILGTTAWLAPGSDFFAWLFRLELAFFIVAFIGIVGEHFRWKLGALGYPYYFLAMNAALFLGFLKFLFRRQAPVWKVVRE